MKYFSRRYIKFLCLIGILLSTNVLPNAQPNSSDEIGIQYGNFVILGDVDHQLFPGWGVSLSYRKALNAVVSIRPSVFYGITYGLDAKPTTSNIFQEAALFEGYSLGEPWFFSYQCKLFRLHLQAVIELSNLGPEKKVNPFNYYLLLGAGFNSSGTWLNLRDEQQLPYQNLLGRTGFNTINDFNTSAGRKAIRKELQSIYDDTYETPGFKEVGKYRLGDETNIDIDCSAGIGIAYRLTHSVSVCIEHEYIFTPSDYLDGNRWRTEQDATTKSDKGQFTSLGLIFRLSSKRKTDPLQWVNPWLLQDTKEDSLKTLIDSLFSALADDDQDGVINAMDEQPASLPNCPVDVKGITSDVDHDGIPDCHDKYPYIDKSEMEEMIGHILEKDRQQISQLLLASQQQAEHHTGVDGNLSGLVYFSPDSDELDIRALSTIAEASVQITRDNLTCITITGHADASFEATYNIDLGLRRADKVAMALREYFGQSKIEIQVVSLGESIPLMVNGPEVQQLAINRRVEIAACK